MLSLKSATIESVSTRADRSLKIVLGTQECSDVDMAALFKAHLESQQGIEINQIDIKDAKSPAQRLRSVLFLDWKQNTNQLQPFNSFYEQLMERFINDTKEKLA